MNRDDGAPKLNPWLRAISPYQGGEARVAGVARVVKLSSNENPLGPSPSAADAFRRAASKLHVYPDGSASRLRAAISEIHDVDKDWISCGAGSDELISLLCLAYAGAGTEVLHATHAFAMYRISALAVGATPVVAADNGLGADIDAILAAITPRTRIIFLANPNNPTGTLLTRAEIAKLVDGAPSHVMIVLDAAYAEYMTTADYENGFALVEQHPNVVMLRTFSKIYGLAALRVGWAYAHPDVIDALNRVRGPFNVGAPNQEAAEAAIRDQEYARHCAVQNEAWRDWLGKKLADAGAPTPDTYCNFVLPYFGVEGPRSAAAADAFLRQRGLIARRLDSYKMPGRLRITVGAAEDCAAIAAAVAAFMQDPEGAARS